jgi:hypothetical protein
MGSGGVWLSHAPGDTLRAAGLTGIRLPDAGMEAA